MCTVTVVSSIAKGDGVCLGGHILKHDTTYGWAKARFDFGKF